MRAVILTFVLLVLEIGRLRSQDALSILTNLKNNLTQSQRLSLDFDFTIKEPEGKAFTTKGNAFQKGKKFFVKNKYLSQLYDGKSLYLFFHKKKNVQVVDYDENRKDNLLSPFILIQLYESKDYEYILMPGAKNAIKVIEFKPTKSDAKYFKVRLSISNSNKLAQAILFERNGTRYTIDFKKTDTVSEISDATFSFNLGQYKGYKVEDLRLD